jgi:inosose dehydratase
MSSITLAGGPVSWGVDFAGDPGNPPYTDVLDGIERAGLTHLELGPVGYLPPDALATRPLDAVGTFVFDDFHRAAPHVLQATDAALGAIAAAGGTLLILIDRPSDIRAVTAGQADRAPRLGRPAFTRMADTFLRAAERAHTRGIRPVLHPHAGGYVEFEDEIDRLLEATGVGLCLDTGHALYAGSDPAELIRRHASRLEHLHLKDLREHAVSPFWDAVRAGAFCPIGDGLLDLRSLQVALEATAYRGFATVEQDRRPGSPGDPVEDLVKSVGRVRAAGIGAAQEPPDLQGLPTAGTAGGNAGGTDSPTPLGDGRT